MLDEVVSGQVAIEFWFGFVQSAVCCHIHQARILRWMDGMCEDRNHVRAKLRGSELLGDWVKDKVGNRAPFPERRIVSLHDLGIPAIQITNHIEQFRGEVDTHLILRDDWFTDLEHPRHFESGIERTALEHLQRSVVQAFDFLGFDGR